MTDREMLEAMHEELTALHGMMQDDGVKMLAVRCKLRYILDRYDPALRMDTLEMMGTGGARKGMGGDHG